MVLSVIMSMLDKDLPHFSCAYLDDSGSRKGKDQPPETEKLTHRHQGKDNGERIQAHGLVHDKRLDDIPFNDHIDDEIGSGNLRDEPDVTGMYISDKRRRDHRNENAQERDYRCKSGEESIEQRELHPQKRQGDCGKNAYQQAVAQHSEKKTFKRAVNFAAEIDEVLTFPMVEHPFYKIFGMLLIEQHEEDQYRGKHKIEG